MGPGRTAVRGRLPNALYHAMALTHTYHGLAAICMITNDLIWLETDLCSCILSMKEPLSANAVPPKP